MLNNNFELVKYFFIGIIFQIIFFESWSFLGHFNPFFYLIYIVIYRFDKSHTKLIITSFFLGLILDLLTGNPGSNTIACLTVSYLRPFLINFSFGISGNSTSGIFSNNKIESKLLFIGLVILFHHFIYYLISYFSLLAYFNIIKGTIINGSLSFIIIVISLGLINKKS